LADFVGFLAAFAYSAGAIVCHQLPERSFFLAGRQWPVCARCSGLYLGIAVGLVAWIAMRRVIKVAPVEPRRAIGWLALAAAPTAISWASGVMGFWDGTNVIRAVLALPLGLAGGAVVAAVAGKDLR
jgi:uncharacterized membrane protein